MKANIIIFLETFNAIKLYDTDNSPNYYFIGCHYVISCYKTPLHTQILVTDATLGLTPQI